MARTAPQGRPDPRPIISTADGGDTAVIDAADIETSDIAEMYSLVRHRFGCPMEDSPYASETEEIRMEMDGGGSRVVEQTVRAGRDQRMEHFRAQPPRTDRNPNPGPVIVVACLECGARVTLQNIE